MQTSTDTLKIAKRLISVDFSDKQAEEIASILRERDEVTVPRAEFDKAQSDINKGSKAQDKKTNSRYDALNDKIDSSVEALNDKIDSSVEALNDKIDSSVEVLNNKIDSSIAALDNKFTAEFKLVRQEMKTESKSIIVILGSLMLTSMGMLMAFIKYFG